MKKGTFLILLAVSLVSLGQVSKVSALSYDNIISNVSTSSAQISWTNDVLTYSNHIKYGTIRGEYPLATYLSCDGISPTTSQTASTNQCIKLTNLTPGTTYFYKIFSYISNNYTETSGTSGSDSFTSSSEHSFTTSHILSTTLSSTTQTVTYPIAPTNLTAMIEKSLVDGGVTRDYVYLQWSSLSNVNSVVIMKYSNGNITEIPVTMNSFTMPSYNDHNVTPGVSYNYKVRVCNGDLCSFSTIISITVPQIITTQIMIEKPITTNGISTSTNSVTLNWQDKSNNETNFKIFRSNSTSEITSSPISTVSANSTTYTDSNLASGNYIYSISACNESICSDRVYFSPQVNIAISTLSESIQTKPAQPTIISLSTSTTPGTLSEVITTLSWNPVSSVTSYKISSSNNVGTLVTSSTSLIVGRNLMPGTYTYYVTACTSDTNCSVSSQRSITIPQVITTITATTTTVTRPNSPTNLSISTTTNFTANLSWSVISGLTYNIKNNVTGITEINKTSPYNVGIPPYGTSYYSVQACSGASNCSSFVSTYITIPQPIIASKPISPINAYTSISSSYNNSSSVSISWLDKSDNEDSFKIVRTYGDQSKTYELPRNTQFYNDFGLSSGLYTYNIYACNSSGCSTPNTTSINVPDAPSKNLSGTVTFPDGKLVVGAKVTAYNVTKSVTAITDTFGKYSLILPGGIYTVSVSEENTVNKTWVVDNTNVFIDVDKVVNFSVKQLVSTLSTSVIDEFGNPLSNIGIIINNSEGVRVATQITDARGYSSTLVNVGTYTVNTVFSQNLLYIPAERQTISINDSEMKSISFVLKKKEISNVFELRGVTKFDDGVVTNAYVSAWSDNGGYRSTYSSSINGEFFLTLSANDIWHISANKDRDGKSYKTTEVLITQNTYTTPISLFFIKNNSETLPQLVIANTTNSQMVKVVASDGAGITLDPNSTISSGLIDVQVKPTTEAPTQKSAEVISTVYDITIKNNTGTNVTTLASEAQITIPYSEEALRAQGVSVEGLIPSYFDEKIGTWVSVPKFTIDKSKKIFTLYVQHLTRFALIASADTTAPSSPTNIVTDAITSTDVKMTWQNPQSDFHHVKIYRSDKLGSIGELIAAEVLSNSFIDKTFSTVAKTYYYTIRSVDNAGNESDNNNQIASAILGDKFASKNKSSSLALPPGQVVVGTIKRKLSLGSKGDDVTSLQMALKTDGFYATGPITGYYGKLTKNAVTRFQNYYKSEILTPNGYKTGTGIVGPATMKKINEILANNS